MKLQIEIPSTDDHLLEQQVWQRWNSVTKPPGSLGRLESLVLEYALMHGTAHPPIDRKAMVIFCADHGVTAEGVSAFPREVTAQMVANFVNGGAAISVLCRQHGVQPVIVDAGVDGPVQAGVLNYKCAEGTRNFAKEPAMTMEQAGQALHNGLALARDIQKKFDVVGIGEMGIGNTTSASALLCAFTGCTPGEAAGAGTGLERSRIAHKAHVIAGALKLHASAIATQDPAEILCALGGFEIATMAGFLLGAASQRLPVIVDGFICGAATLLARSFDPSVMDFLIFSHKSAESAHDRMLCALGKQPLLDLGLRLGEGTGAVLAISLLASAIALYGQMATFEQGRVSAG